MAPTTVSAGDPLPYWARQIPDVPMLNHALFYFGRVVSIL
jgi:hypothetical protein